MTRFPLMPTLKANRRTVLKLSVSAAALWVTAVGVTALRSDTGTWVLRDDDA